MPRGLRTALTCAIVATATLVSCSSAPPAGGPRPAPGSGGSGDLFRAPQPWTVDVSGAPASERSTAVLTALTDAGGWGNGNVLQIDLAMPVLRATAGTAGSP